MNVVFLGDLCLDNLSIEESISIAKELERIKRPNDYFIANLECPVTNSKSAMEKAGPNLKCDKEKGLRILSNLPIDSFSLANNHILDFGKEGLADTIEVLNSANKKHFGAGLSIAEADAPLCDEIISNMLDIYSVAESEFCLASDYGYGASSQDPISIIERIIESKKKNKKVIVIVHGGNEHYYLPSPHFKKRLELLVASGADLIVSHHTHVSTGMSSYKGKEIYFSLGNFVFKRDDVQNSWNSGHGVRLNVEDFSTNIIPFRQFSNNLPLEFLDKNSIEHAQYMENFDKLSRIILDKDRLQIAWKKYVESRTKSYTHWILMMSKLESFANKKLGINRFSFSKRNNIRMMENIIKCESHKDLLLEVLSEKK
ncbi:CapA family protein [Vibrio parahaemolyticus]|uniref:CapA family protein n=1 Tax=Vibrio parahaemolyticus TaxID=670 RepID=UPI001B816E0E|nr:CapA family protein [Vibrio parahaemolyticus]MCR9818514.1 CapA family protein [Vibrio parahaemolyticus]MDF5077077.1 CapA family protein [Vibrio parahaemolyticus]MDF5413413.1 CapA family protein [Vibrio parahaemolyticus]MDF5424212.1 CapA family protein [Vibrio parahaemolyticus]MEA5336895.1 CapA family protein [Vibrio parahaemolyticus]